MDELVFCMELVGTAAFAVSGAMTGLRKGMDLMGVVILGLITAVGGGVLRDLLLGITPPKIFDDPQTVGVAAAVSVVAFLPPVCAWLMKSTLLFERLLLAADSVGLAIFTVVGIRVAYAHEPRATLFLLAFVGVVTGVGGGVLRDIMAGDTPYIFVKHVYACASLVGALACALAWHHLGEMGSMLLSGGLVVVIRCLSAHYRWNLPRAHD